MLPQRWKTIIQGSQTCLQQGKLRVKSKEEQHEEEEDGPQPGQGEAGQSLWVGNKCKSLSSFGNIFDVDTSLLREVAKNREHHAARDDRGDEVQGGDNCSINVDLVVESERNKQSGIHYYY